MVLYMKFSHVRHKGGQVSEYRLTEEIIKLSNASVWDLAKLEWVLDRVYWEDTPDTCLCGHFPIKEICIIRNNGNQNTATVGNCCVKKFIGLPSDKIFQAIKRVQKDIEKSLNVEAVEHAHSKGWINTWERDFYVDIMRKRKLSEKQLAKKVQVNRKAISNIVNARNR